MDLFRKIGVGIVMIVPTFVFGGLLYHFFHSWLAVLGWAIVMAFVLRAVVTRKSNSGLQRA